MLPLFNNARVIKLNFFKWLTVKPLKNLIKTSVEFITNLHGEAFIIDGCICRVNIGLIF